MKTKTSSKNFAFVDRFVHKVIWTKMNLLGMLSVEVC